MTSHETDEIILGNGELDWSMKSALQVSGGDKQPTLLLNHLEERLLDEAQARARSAKFWMSANTGTLLLAPFDKFLVPYWVFLAGVM